MKALELGVGGVKCSVIITNYSISFKILYINRISLCEILEELIKILKNKNKIPYSGNKIPYSGKGRLWHTVSGNAN